MGAHVSIRGGLHRAVARGREIGATALQIFTKQPQRWADPELDEGAVTAFREAVQASPIAVVSSHDSYLINLGSEKPELYDRSRRAFRSELARCLALGVDYLVTHPGNATGGDRGAALRRNARAIGEALAEHPGPTEVLVENTAGSGTALGWHFEELSRLVAAVPEGQRSRVGVCLDTAHLFAAGYDLASDYAGVMEAFEGTVGLDRLKLFHLNDSKAELGSRVDRHAHIGRGEMGEAAFAALMKDPAVARVPRVLETPKDGDEVEADRANLATLRRLAGVGE